MVKSIFKSTFNPISRIKSNGIVLLNMSPDFKMFSSYQSKVSEVDV